MLVLNYAIVSGFCLHVKKFCKCLPAKNEKLPFTRVIVSPLLQGILQGAVGKHSFVISDFEYERACVIQSMVKSLYTGDVEFSVETVQPLKSLYQYLLLDKFVEACEEASKLISTFTVLTPKCNPEEASEVISSFNVLHNVECRTDGNGDVKTADDFVSPAEISLETNNAEISLETNNAEISLATNNAEIALETNNGEIPLETKNFTFLERDKDVDSLLLIPDVTEVNCTNSEPSENEKVKITESRMENNENEKIIMESNTNDCTGKKRTRLKRKQKLEELEDFDSKLIESGMKSRKAKLQKTDSSLCKKRAGKGRCKMKNTKAAEVEVTPGNDKMSANTSSDQCDVASNIVTTSVGQENDGDKSQKSGSKVKVSRQKKMLVKNRQINGRSWIGGAIASNGGILSEIFIKNVR